MPAEGGEFNLRGEDKRLPAAGSANSAEHGWTVKPTGSIASDGALNRDSDDDLLAGPLTSPPNFSIAANGQSVLPNRTIAIFEHDRIAISGFISPTEVRRLHRTLTVLRKNWTKPRVLTLDEAGYPYDGDPHAARRYQS